MEACDGLEALIHYPNAALCSDVGLVDRYAKLLPAILGSSRFPFISLLRICQESKQCEFLTKRFRSKRDAGKVGWVPLTMAFLRLLPANNRSGAAAALLF